jgi:hypothetical protein
LRPPGEFFATSEKIVKKLKPYSENAEVIGRAAIGILMSVNRKHYQPILDRHNITDLDPNTWYSHKMFLEVMREIRDHSHGMDAMYDLMAIGMKVAEKGLEGVELPDIKSFFLSDGFRVDLMHRGQRPGYAVSHQEGERKIIIEDHTPWPHDFMFGIYYVFARHFDEPDRKVSVQRIGIEIDHNTGDEYGIYEITW